MSKPVTSYDVAKHAGVSRSLVSAVINGTIGIGVSKEKRIAIYKSIEELGYRVNAQAHGMRTNRSYCIAAFSSVYDSLFIQVLKGVQLVCNQKGYHVLLSNPTILPSMSGGKNEEEQRAQLIDWFLKRRIDGVLALEQPGYGNKDWIQQVQRYQLPHVSIEGYPEHPDIPSVNTDYKQSIRTALDYLWEKTNIAPHYIEIYQDDYGLTYGDINRREAYLTWMDQRGFSAKIESVPEQSWEQQSQFWIQWLSQNRLSQNNKPMVCLVNWFTGVHKLYQAVMELGWKIGQDIFLMSADDTEMANRWLLPQSNWIELPYKEMGKRAAHLLLEYIEGKRDKEDAVKISLPAQLF